VATLTIRNLDEALKARLRIRAAENGRSMEAEVRELLSAALASPDARPSGAGSAIHERFQAFELDELDLPRRDEPPRAADLS
jgi:plasmid stability protein